MALDFDGTDDYVDCGAGSTLDDIVAMSVAFWVFNDDLGTSNEGLIEKRGTTGWLVYAADFSVANALHFFRDWSTTDGEWRTPTNALVASIWQHIVVTYDKSGAAPGNDPAIYVDGVSQSLSELTTPAGTVVSDAAVSLLFGKGVSGVGKLNGKMEDVRVFNRILTQEEISLLASGFRGPLGGEAGWWTCQDFQAITHPDGTTLTAGTHYLRDASGNGNTGNPTGGVIARGSDAPSAFPMWLAVHGFGQLAKDLTGAISFAGALVRQTNKVVAGAISFAGALVRQTNKVVAGAITFAGALVRLTNKVVAGAITFVGAVVTVLGRLTLFFADAKRLFIGTDQDSTLSAPEHTRRHKG